MMDRSSIPLVALSSQTKELISALLNPTKHIPDENNVPRDWRGLAYKVHISGELLPSIHQHPDPFSRILEIMEKGSKKYSIKDLQNILQSIDRWDITEDAEPFIEKDVQQYMERMERCQTSAKEINDDIDSQILTVDDLFRTSQGLTKQYYDAFVLYADEDENFAEEMINNLEKKYNLKLCIKERDLIAGLKFEHDAVLQLISERCNRLIVVLSPNFLKSPVNEFFLNYAHAINLDKGSRKIVPCVYQKCELPNQLKCFYLLDYNKAHLYDFWQKLYCSINTSPATSKNIRPLISISKTASELSPLPLSVPDSIKNSEKNVPLELPSVSSLDDLSLSESLQSTEKPKKMSKKKYINNCVKKMQSLLLKS